MVYPTFRITQNVWFPRHCSVLGGVHIVVKWSTDPFGMTRNGWLTRYYTV